MPFSSVLIASLHLYLICVIFSPNNEPNLSAINFCLYCKVTNAAQYLGFKFNFRFFPCPILLSGAISGTEATS